MSNNPEEAMTVVARGRLAMLAAYLRPSELADHDVLHPLALSAQFLPLNLAGTLTVVDDRTGKKYQLQVSKEGTVRASDLKKCLHSFSGNRSYKPNPQLTRALDIIFILHAEHEMNCSTSAVRHLASSGVDVYTAIAGAVGALYGPLHGGANEAVLKMLSEIGTVQNIPEFIEGVKTRKKKLSGFGHRVYKNYDPRAKVLRKLAEEVFSIVGRDPLIEVAVALEKVALSDEYFIKRKLYPNVDFYSGLIYRAMGFPPEYFTVLFAIPRMAGYLSHWRESLDDPDTKIMRPQQVYVGEWLRNYMPINLRTPSNNADKLGEVTISNASKRRLAGSGV